MDFSLTDKQRILGRSARQFLEAECPAAVVREAETTEQGHVPELWGKMADLGWLGMSLPEMYGGTGGSLTDQVVLFEEIGRALVPGPLLVSSVLASQIVLNAGNDSQKESLLPGIASGGLILTLARGERLETASGETGLTLSGESAFVPHAGVANHIICATRPAVGAWPDTTLVVVDGEGDQVFKTPMESIANYPQCLVEFDDICLPSEALLGDIAEGRPVLDAAVQRAIVVQCAETLGRAQKVLEMVVEYASVRVQFGRPIGTFQAVQHRCSDLKVAIDSGRMLTYQAAWRLDQGLLADDEVSMAKAQSGTLSRTATEVGHSIFAGISFTIEHDMQLYSARAKISEANLGDTEYHLDQISIGVGPQTQ